MSVVTDIGNWQEIVEYPGARNSGTVTFYLKEWGKEAITRTTKERLIWEDKDFDQKKQLTQEDYEGKKSEK